MRREACPGGIMKTAGTLTDQLTDTFRESARSGRDQLSAVVREVGLQSTIDVIAEQMYKRIKGAPIEKIRLTVTFDSESATRDVKISNTDSKLEHVDDAVEMLSKLFMTPEQKPDTLHGFLRGVHRRLDPETYLEVGVAFGESLELSRAKSIAIDPGYVINREIRCDVALYRQTSDNLFSSPECLNHFTGASIDLAFIDGLHVFEQTLRDFINIERHSHPSSVVVIDDVLPISTETAEREPSGQAWNGDVFKILKILNEYRSDLVLMKVDTRPTGVLVVLGLDSKNDTLSQHYDDIVRQHSKPDPQQVPAALIDREGAIGPIQMLDSDLWSILKKDRDLLSTRRQTLDRIMASIAGIPIQNVE